MLSGSVLRVAQKLLVAVAALLVVPIAVNIGTGGTPPPWLAPFTGWLWPVAGACVLLIVVLELVEQQGSVRDGISARRPDDPRNVERALDQVARYVDLRQRNSLAERVRIALALDERPDAVHQPIHLVQRIGGGQFEVREAGQIAEVFEELSGSMLVLGAPGAGKSTQLLDLAERLVADGRAERADDPAAQPPVPVVLDLAEWSRAGVRRRRLLPWSRASGPLALSAWLGAALRDRYGIPALVSASWLADDRLVLLLDGLDEVREGDRERCVQEINGLQRHVTRLVVCSRTADYESLRGRLRLQGAVEIQPFRPEQVAAFLGAVSPQLRGVADALSEDDELWELLTTPLMLNIMALAYGEGAGPSVPAGGDAETRRRLLFDSYVVEVLARRRAGTWRGDTERVLLALRTLALFATATGSGVTVGRPGADGAHRGFGPPLHGILGGWLSVASSSAAAVAAAALVAEASGVGAGLVIGAALCGVSAICLSGSLLTTSAGRTTAPRLLVLLAWWVLVTSAVYVLARTVTTLLTAAVSAIWPDVDGPLTACLSAVASVALWTAFAFSAPAGTEPDTPTPQPLVVLAVVSGACALAAVLIVPHPASASFWLAIVGALLGFVGGLGLAFTYAGPLRRLAFLLADEPDPWRRSLLRFATDRSLLSFVDTEYRFVHLLVRDHLAGCDPAALSAAVASRRQELVQRV